MWQNSFFCNQTLSLCYLKACPRVGTQRRKLIFSCWFPNLETISFGRSPNITHYSAVYCSICTYLFSDYTFYFAPLPAISRFCLTVVTPGRYVGYRTSAPHTARRELWRYSNKHFNDVQKHLTACGVLRKMFSGWDTERTTCVIKICEFSVVYCELINVKSLSSTS